MLASFSKSGKKFVTLNNLAIKSFSVSSAHHKNKNVAMILSGCGVFDGTEITEATSIIIHLSRHNANVNFFAPNTEQMHVVNHLTGDILPEKRNVLIESARICRGNIHNIERLRASNFDALIIPGGFGAAKNLSDYALQSQNLKINSDVERCVREFNLAMKPIGFCCISPVIAAKLLPTCEITVGKQGPNWPYCGTIDVLKLMDATVIEKDVNEAHVDQKFKVVTTPAFMKNASYHEIYDGIGKMVEALLKLS